MDPEDGSSLCAVSLSEDQKVQIDSLLRYYMDYYHIELDFNYEVVHSDKGLLPSSDNTFGQKLNPGLSGHYQLRIKFPGQQAFIMSELKGIFLSTLLLTLILIIIFYYTIRSLVKSQETLKRTTDFVNNMTHEMNTPIANINLATGRLYKDDLPEGKRSTYLNIIKDETEKLRSNVERLLDVASLDKQGFNARPEKLDMHDLLNNVAESVKMRIMQSGGKLTLETNAIQSVVEADRTHLSNALLNLLDNALKYSDKSPLIAISTFNEKDTICIKVKDNGVGISAADQKKIFERYFRASTGDVHTVKGFGIGLNYVWNVAKMHRGNVTVSSIPGEGSTFTLILPVIK
jgi:two-component system, OmpR family, phosphate regulon sensor histidine kinase PhoR